MNCFLCGENSDKHLIELTNRMNVCHKCFSLSHGFRCSSCGGFYLGDEYNINYRICIYCAKGMKHEVDDDKIHIHNYYFKPYPVFYKLDNEKELYLGIELEIGGNDEAKNVNLFAANFENDFFYIKKDRSIPRYGCEIVSYPATLEYHKSNKSKWKEILNGAKQFGFKSYDINDCGIHVHVNKNYFNGTEIAKLDCFVNKNFELFTKFARRTSKYSTFLCKPYYLYGNPLNVNRHCAVNLCNENTIEFRIFKGTLNYNSFISILELIYYLAQFIKSDIKFEDILSRNDTVEIFLNGIKNSNLEELKLFCIKNNIFS